MDYNHEATDNSYLVTVKVSDATASATIDVTITVTDVDEQPDTPAKPTVTAVSGATDSLTVTWSEPDLNGGPAITGYGVEYRVGASGTWTDWSHSGTAATTTITGLTADTYYQVQVRALNGETPSAWSAPSDAVSTNAPTAPGKPTGLTATASGRTQIDLSWTAPTDTGGSAITGYKIEVSTDGSTWTDRVADTGNDGTSYSHTGLEAGDTRHYRVSAINAEGTSAPSDAVSTNAVAPGMPTDLKAAAKSQTRIQLAWTAPADVGSFAIAGYTIEVSENENAGAPWNVLTGHTGSARTDYRHVGLEADDTRHYRVSAISAAGTSAPSNVASATTMAAGPAATNPVLPPPQDVNATPILPGEIRLGWWRNPNEPSKGLVDRHQYRYRVRNAGTWTVDWTTVNQTMLPGGNEIRNYNSVLLRELTAWTAYEFQVRSVDKAATYSAGVSALATAVGPRTIRIQADTHSVREGAPLPFTLSRAQPHGRLYVIVRIRETGDMLPPDGLGRDGAWTEGVYFGDGNTTIPLVLETVNDLGGSEPDSVVTVEVLPSTRQPGLGSATITVTAASDAGSSRGGVAAPLTAAFEGLPAAHDGETAFTFRIAFSEAVTVTPAAMRTRVLTVTGGAVTSASAARVDGESGVWAITLTPDTRGALSITLAPTAACEADSAVCTADGRALSIGAAHLVSGPGPETQTQEVQTPLTASFEGMPAAHDGEDAFRFRVAFSEDIGISFKALRDESFTTTGGAVTGARRVDRRNDLWEITVEPSGAENVTITLPRGRDCGTTGAVCTRGDTPRALTNSPSATVQGPSATVAPPPSEPLTASFSGVPASHDGQQAFTFGLTFSEDVAELSYKTLRDSAFSVTNGQVRRARRKTKGSNQSWTITVKPDSSGEVKIRLPATTDCEADDAICTSDARPLSNSPSATIPGAAALDFAHFAKGATITSEMVLVNAAPHPSRPAIYFYDTEGDPIAPDSVVDVTGDLEVTEDGALTVRTEMESLAELTISTHGQGEPVSGSVKVVSDGPLGVVVRYGVPEIGVAGVGPGQPTSDALFPVRRQAGGIRTAAALHNLEAEAMGVNCRLMSGGVALEEVEIHLEANGQTSWFIEDTFTATDTSDFGGSVRCTAPGNGRFTAVALEMDAANRIFTTLPVVPVDPPGSGNQQTTLDFAHFANGTGITSEMVFLNPSTQPSRPAVYFYDTEGNPIAAESVVDITGDLEITEDGALTVWTEMEPLGELTISTHGRGELVTGSVRVVSDGPIGGLLRFDLPGVGAGVVGASLPISDALFPVRRQEGGINTWAAIHNLESSPGLLRCDLMREGVLLDVASIPLEANGQTSWFIDQAFPGADTSDFAGSVRCDAVGEGLFSAVALEMDPGNRIFTTLPVVPVPEMPDQE